MRMTQAAALVAGVVLSAGLAAGTAKADTVGPYSYVQLSGCTIGSTHAVLWYNNANGQWHGQITGGHYNDIIYLDYSDSPQLGYNTDVSSVGPGQTSVNTPDEVAGWGRVELFPASGGHCVGVWHVAP
ncbi:hypothetical protein [Actinophytocola sp.]|uniref:hypothetical protein n=1 Tax=Actinophytocola sp. TaxID=1872138 RepID=UPI00389A8F63